MSITDEYNRRLQQNNFLPDHEQQKVVEQLHVLQLQLQQLKPRQHSTLSIIASLFRARETSPQGCYIWGDVGRGKTWLMDMFFDTLDNNTSIGERKIRLHFHHFMRAIHDQLSLIDGQKNPLQHVARAFARRYQLLCLDEFHVSDITDAMLLSGLLQTLFEEGVVLVATSNQPPDDLYKNGLQRDRFLPAIALIKNHTLTMNLNGPEDHRLRLLEKADTWYLHSRQSQTSLESRFLELSTSPARRDFSMQINYRRIKTILCANDIIWTSFSVMCGDQRGSSDYIEIARQFHTVFISDIPQMNDNQNDMTKRFINMIDEFYDRKVNLLVSAATQPETLYEGKQLEFEFKRTVSRLQEMRSHEYMQQAHKPV